MNVIRNGSLFAVGMVIGIAALVGMGVNYAIYKRLPAKGRQKYAFEIIELAKEISGTQAMSKAGRILYRLLRPAKGILYLLPPLSFDVLFFYLCSTEGAQRCGLSGFYPLNLFACHPHSHPARTGKASHTGKGTLRYPGNTGR